METTHSLARRLLELANVPVVLLKQEFGLVLLEDVEVTNDHEIEVPQADGVVTPASVVVLT